MIGKLAISISLPQIQNEINEPQKDLITLKKLAHGAYLMGTVYIDILVIFLSSKDLKNHKMLYFILWKFLNHTSFQHKPNHQKWLMQDI